MSCSPPEVGSLEIARFQKSLGQISPVTKGTSNFFLPCTYNVGLPKQGDWVVAVFHDWGTWLSKQMRWDGMLQSVLRQIYTDLCICTFPVCLMFLSEVPKKASQSLNIWSQIETIVDCCQILHHPKGWLKHVQHLKMRWINRNRGIKHTFCIILLRQLRPGWPTGWLYGGGRGGTFQGVRNLAWIAGDGRITMISISISIYGELYLWLSHLDESGFFPWFLPKLV